MATDLYHAAFGDPNDPAVVFLHGGPGANSWAFEYSSAERLATQLAARKYYVIPYDQRGSGRSPPPNPEDLAPNVCTLSNFTKDLDDLINALGLPSKPILVGFSYGGFLSLNYLEQYQGAKGVVMVGTPINFPEAYYTILTRIGDIFSKFRIENWIEDPHANVPSAEQADWWRNALLAGAAEMLKARMFPNGLTRPFNFARRDLSFLWELVRAAGLLYSPSEVLFKNVEFLLLMLGLAHRPDFYPWFFDQNTDVPDYFHRNQPEIAHGDHTGLLSRVNSRLPVHAIYSREDRLFSARQMDAINRLLPHGRFSYIDGAGHFTFLEHNKEFLDVLSVHLASF